MLKGKKLGKMIKNPDVAKISNQNDTDAAQELADRKKGDRTSCPIDCTLVRKTKEAKSSRRAVGTAEAAAPFQGEKRKEEKRFGRTRKVNKVAKSRPVLALLWRLNTCFLII